MNYEESLAYTNEVIERLKLLKPGRYKDKDRQLVNDVIGSINNKLSVYKKQMKVISKNSDPESFQPQVDGFVKDLDQFYEGMREEILKDILNS